MVNINGQIIAAENAQVAIHNRGLHYGDALFETMRFHRGTIAFMDDHYLRMTTSLQLLKMELPNSLFSKARFLSEIHKTIPNLEHDYYRVKIILWRDWGGKYAPTHMTAHYAIFVESLNEGQYRAVNSPYEVAIYEDHFSPSGVLSSLKTNNKIAHVLAAIAAQARGVANVFIRNEHGDIVEAANGNIFVLSGDTITTPPLYSGCLNGVLRKQILRLVTEKSSFSLIESNVTEADLLRADEVWITNVISGITAVSRFRTKSYENRIAINFTDKLNREMIN